MCAYEGEDQDHFIRCMHPTREQWRTETIMKMQRYGIESYMETENARNTNGTKSQYQTPEQWLIGWISVLRAKWFEVWESRNAAVHGSDNQSRIEAEQSEESWQLQNIYSNQLMMEPRVQDLLLPTPEAHDEHSIQVNTNWLQLNTPIFAEKCPKSQSFGPSRC